MAARRRAAAATAMMVSTALAAMVGSSAYAATLIHAGRVIDGVSERVLSERTLVIDGGRIVAIEPGFRAPGAGYTVIDLRGSTLMPGLMDMHVHLTSEYSRSSAGDGFRKNGTDVALDGAMYAERTLMAGFTTVRDLGD